MTRIVVAVAGTAEEERSIERLLDANGVPYETGLDASEHSQGVCFLGRTYAVEEDRVVAVRELLRRNGHPLVE